MKIFDGVIRWSIARKTFVLVVALAVSAYGAYAFVRMPVDVFPDLTAPTVTVVTEAHGLAPEEVESLITTPIEAAMNGQTEVRRVRSAWTRCTRATPDTNGGPRRSSRGPQS